MKSKIFDFIAYEFTLLADALISLYQYYYLVDLIILVLIFLVTVVFLVKIVRYLVKCFDDSQVAIQIPFGLGNITYNVSKQDRIIAWNLYVQLITRKAALQFNEKEDIIADVYKSLYDIFPIARQLLSNVSANEYKMENGLADMIFRVLNDGLRPHLTKWQSEYLCWLEQAKKCRKYSNLKPLDIQKKYRNYRKLIKELKKTNVELKNFAEELLKIAQANVINQRTKKINPVAPN